MVTVLEGNDVFTVLAAAVTASAAAIVDARIDCFGLLSGGCAVQVRDPSQVKEEDAAIIVLDPDMAEHEELVTKCVVAYLPERDKITELWFKGDTAHGAGELVDKAIDAAVATRFIVSQAVREGTELRSVDAARERAASEKREVHIPTSNEVNMTG